MRILFLEDEIILALTFVEALNDMGVGEVVHAADLEEAERALEASPFDLGILDVNLEGRSSLDFARKFMAAGGVVIFATGYTDDGELFSEFACRVLRKPYEAEELEAMVRGAIRGRMIEDRP